MIIIRYDSLLLELLIGSFSGKRHFIGHTQQLILEGYKILDNQINWVHTFATSGEANNICNTEG